MGLFIMGSSVDINFQNTGSNAHIHSAPPYTVLSSLRMTFKNDLNE